MLSWFTAPENFAQLQDGVCTSVKSGAAAIKGPDSGTRRWFPWLSEGSWSRGGAQHFSGEVPLSSFVPHRCLVLAVYLFKQHLPDISAQRVRDQSTA